METYEQLKQKIDSEYPVVRAKMIELEKEIWKDIAENRTKLEKIVGDEFGKVVKEIGPVVSKWYLADNPDVKGAEILDYNTRYLFDNKYIEIKITKLKLPDGRIMDDDKISTSQYGCPHAYLEPVCSLGEENLDTRIIDFRKKFGVDRIEQPDNDCDHK